MSKRTDRIAAAKALPPDDLARRRFIERAPPEHTVYFTEAAAWKGNERTHQTLPPSKTRRRIERAAELKAAQDAAAKTVRMTKGEFGYILS